MAHFALLNNNNVVVQVIVVNNDSLLDENGVEQEKLGIQFCQDIIRPGKWIQTSYNNNFRGRFAGIGYIYSEELDVFHRPQPGSNLILTETGEWVPAIPPPDDYNPYEWDYENATWVPLIPDEDLVENNEEEHSGEQTT